MEDNTSKVHVEPDSSPLPLVVQNAGNGSQLFVINLCASLAPVSTAGRNIPGLENYKLYQVARVEDGRTRHRLRLGFFNSEAHAERVLTIVRQQYPTAFTASLGDEDRRFARGYLPERTAPAPRPTVAVVNTKPPVPVAPVAATTPLAAGVTSAPAAAKPVAAKPADAPGKPATPPAPVLVPPKLDTAASMRVPALTFSDPEPTPAPAQKANGSDQPYHVGKGLEFENIQNLKLELLKLELDDDAPAQPAPAASPTAPNKSVTAKPAAPAARKIEAPAKQPASKPSTPIAKPVAPALVRDAARVHPNLDSTQTIRALTSEELSDGSQEKWFAIQLAASEQPVNLDTMPHLDIFEAYRLYSVATAGSGKIVHSLRLGFFKEAVSAEAVCGYLKTFFAAPSVLRVSVAEHVRFNNGPQPRRAEPLDEPKNNVVELNNTRTQRAPVIPTVTMEVDPATTGAFRPNATGAFRPNATGSLNSATGTFKPGATGAFKAHTTGTFKPNATGAFKLSSTGAHQALDNRLAARSTNPATKRSEPIRVNNTGKHKVLKKSLAQELLEEAREVALSESGIRKLPQNNSLLARLLGRKK